MYVTLTRLLTACSITLLLSTAHAQQSGSWTYQGDTGPENWSQLHPDFSACNAGKNQSPVNISGLVDGQLPALEPQYQPGSRIISNDGLGLAVIYDPENHVVIGEKSYGLKEIRFHTPSEHTIQNYSYPMEAQLVHADSENNALIVSVMFQPGEHNPELEKAWETMPEDAGQSRLLEDPLDASNLIPQNPEYFRYNGSLTTPPCTEGVAWLVLKFYVTASPEQIVKLARVIHVNNNRPTQPLNARVVIE